jgi:hypothetical protein
MSSYAELEMKVLQWSEQRKIVPNSTPFAQSIKAVEEINELVDALRDGNRIEAIDAVGDTVVRNSSVRVDTVAFTSCSVNSAADGNGNAYGGSFSLYMGGYAWSLRGPSSSISTSGSTNASGVRVSISDVNSSDCSTKTTGQNGANSYGGSMSVYIGAYALSLTAGSSLSSSSQSYCGTTDVSGLVVSISSSRLINSSAVIRRTFSQCPLVSISLT